MNKARIFANILGEIGQECDNIMFGFALNLIDSVNVKGAFFPNYGGCRFGNDPQILPVHHRHVLRFQTKSGTCFPQTRWRSFPVGNIAGS